MAQAKSLQAVNNLVTVLQGFGMGGSVPGTIDLTYVKQLLVGDRAVPTTDGGPICWLYLDNPAIGERYVASSRTKEGIVKVIVDLQRDRSGAAADILTPYGANGVPGILQMVADVQDAIDLSDKTGSWTGVGGYNRIEQTVGDCGSMGEDWWRAIVKLDIVLRYNDTGRRS